MIAMYYVYILKSLKDERYYIGSTKNLDNRISDHNLGRTKSLRYRLPLKLVHYEKYPTQGMARKREKEIKSYKGGNAFKKLIKGQ
jgi:putative endonuclease